MISRRTFIALTAGAATASLTGLSSVLASAGTRARAARNVVLVHGAYADGSSWSEVIERLQAAGLNVTSVQNPLTSLADDVAATRRALALQDGIALRDYARTHAVSINTVYTHFYRIKDKAGCRHLSQLIRKLNDLQPLPLAGPTRDP